MIRRRSELLLETQWLGLEMEEEPRNAGLEAFAAGGGVRRMQEVLEGDHPLPKVAVALHAFSSLLLRSQPPTSRPISSMDLAAKA